jgi:indolepyruvate ferredoxin oxidoreductase
MVALTGGDGKGRITGITQMGGEGAQWIGQAPFTATPHLFQNLGDGTFTHSGSLAIRAAIAAGVNITYKLLHNGVVAMTGAQSVEGAMSVPDLTRWLELEGVRRVIVTTDEIERYRRVRLAGVAEARPRSELDAAQRELSAVPGVTVLIHDQACAAEAGRLRRRGKLPPPRERIVINERVCEGCGDCGRKSHCLSLVPVDTELGRKTRVQQSSCNSDESCVDGDCPAFLRVVPGKLATRPAPPDPGALPDPVRRVAPHEATLRLMGIGGTGVVTASQVLAMAALIDGKRCEGLDQTGLAQKGGPVVSDVRILEGSEPRASRASRGGVDGFLVFDVLGATSAANLAAASPERTVAIVSTSEVPAGAMIGDPHARFPALGETRRRIDRVTRPDANVYLDAIGLAERLFGSHMPANSLVLGAAWQAGLIPLSLSALEQAFSLNGVAVERNLAAFAWGRAAVAKPDAVARVLAPAPSHQPAQNARARSLLARTGAVAGSELARLLEFRIADLLGYQGARCARTYADFVAWTLATARDQEIAAAVARQLHRLMAYKDEYEVARLHLDPVERARIAAEHGAGARIGYQLHPPVLRALGMERKLSLGPWLDPALRLLRSLRFLRGTPLDPFGLARVRRVERALPGEYRALVERALPHVARDRAAVLALCELPDAIRGYEDIKLRNVERFRVRARELADALAAPDPPALDIVSVPGGGAT